MKLETDITSFDKTYWQRVWLENRCETQESCAVCDFFICCGYWIDMPRGYK